jgi:cytochrome P450
MGLIFNGVIYTALGISIVFPTLFLFDFLNKKFIKSRNSKVPPGTKTVPFVTDDYLPIAGHGIAFGKDIRKFIRDKYDKYGPVFRIKIFLTDLVVICDRNLVKQFFTWKESDASMYKVLDRLYFGSAFSDDPDKLPVIITLVKSTIATNFETFSKKIQSQANKMIKRLQKKTSKTKDKINLSDEMIRFVANTSAECFISVELDDELYDILIKFTNYLNFIVKLTYFLPKWFITLTMNPYLAYLRKQITNRLKPEIQKYRNDPNKYDSLVLRRCVDYLEPNLNTNKYLSDQEIGDVIVCLLYVSSENTALGLVAAITDLASNPVWWDNVKYESYKYLDHGLNPNGPDLKGLFSSTIIDDCVMESARMNSHVFALNRQPLDAMTIGDYFISGVQSVVLCEPMFMKEPGIADDLYSDPTVYNPDRFSNKKEPKDSQNIMTWGSGVHLCPGKGFAIYEIKMALALMTLNFKIELPKTLPELDYFSPSAFAERHFKVKLTNVEYPYLNVKPTPGFDSADVCIIHSNDIDDLSINRHTLQYKTLQGDYAWFIPQYFSKEEQKQIYEYIVELSKDSLEHQEIMSVPDTKPYPIMYYNLVYTGKSNCTNVPTNILSISQEILLNLKKTVPDFPVELPIFDSVYAQMYSVNSTMAVHKDELFNSNSNSNLGISINLGASVDFVFGEDIITLNSGDVFVADFTKIPHGIKRVFNSVPKWFDQENGINTFNRVRCSIQIRQVGKNSSEITTQEFKNMILT